jgi:Brp/Blh family beta-carotene 15,15'-monooxygenase
LDFQNLNIRNILIPTTFFCLWLTGFSTEAVEQILALVFIFSFGILHGANDIFLIQKINLGDRALSPVITLALYIAFVFLIALMFYFIPAFALLGFIVFSAFHFGEQHWIGQIAGSLVLKNLFFTVYGLLILNLLFALHEAEVLEVIQEITGKSITAGLFMAGFWISFIAFLALSLILFKGVKWITILPLEILLIGIFWVVFKTASLLWAFAIYFILWHAIPSLMDQLKMLYGRATRKNGRRYLNSAAIYWVGSLLTLATAYFWFRDPEYGFLPIFFSFLAAITFPHVLVMSGFYRNLSESDKS